MTCRRCGAEIRERFIGTTRVLAHYRPALDMDHPPVLAKIAAPTEAEKRAAWGNR